MSHITVCTHSTAYKKSN